MTKIHKRDILKIVNSDRGVFINHFLFKLLGKLLQKRGFKEGDKIRADVFLEIWILWTGIIFFFGSIALSFYAVYIHEYLYFALVALLFINVYILLPFVEE